MIKDTIKRQRISRIYPNNPRNISIHEINSKQHPLNVKPSGNSFITTPDQLEQKKQLLGDFFIFQDELIMLILSYLDIKSLLNLSHTSRILYAFIYDEELWKNKYIELGIEKPWHGSWRNTVLGISQDASLQIPNNLLCSDLLYRPFQNSQIDYHKIFKNLINEEEMYHKHSINGELGDLPPGRIDRIQNMTMEEFNSHYHNLPFILTTGEWPSWTFEELFTRFPNVQFRQEAVSWDLTKYSQYLKQNKDENPLYLFDCNSEAMKLLKKEYSPPSIFTEDYFKVLGICRPFFSWLIMGSQRSGSTFHKDPNSTSAWNAAIQGKKLWIMLPSNITPPGVSTDYEESEVTSPIGIAEWVISGFYNDSTRIPECKIGITFPGETMYVPSGWWHSVINLDDSIALTQNFVPKVKLPNVLNFLKNKPKQISGFKLKNVKECLDEVVKESNNEILKAYVEKFNGLTIDVNEDCGEIKNLPELPVFELFKQLMINNGYEDELNDAIEIMNRIEGRNYANENGKSKKWEKLTEVESTSAFSFNFDEESSDEE
ncbi:unnamed protein product [Candida verbasci]|uniref:JmjC domain-containing protein n=1 Tax=Candida verbasci TaxID=1227364 RepID=A0A9W4TT13_9ASCO|nr:unnamed protein product [Candida verbasci]